MPQAELPVLMRPEADFSGALSCAVCLDAHSGQGRSTAPGELLYPGVLGLLPPACYAARGKWPALEAEGLW